MCCFCLLLSYSIRNLFQSKGGIDINKITPVWKIDTEGKRRLARVKWFNPKAGYGFLTDSPKTALVSLCD